MVSTEWIVHYLLKFCARDRHGTKTHHCSWALQLGWTMTSRCVRRVTDTRGSVVKCLRGSDMGSECRKTATQEDLADEVALTSVFCVFTLTGIFRLWLTIQQAYPARGRSCYTRYWSLRDNNRFLNFSSLFGGGKVGERFCCVPLPFFFSRVGNDWELNTKLQILFLFLLEFSRVAVSSVAQLRGGSSYLKIWIKGICSHLRDPG